jgi:hypothetical protein
MSIYIPGDLPPVVRSAMARVVRRLPYPGKVIARKGSRVDPEEIVASAYVPVEPQVVNVARALAIAPSRVERAMRRERGNKVAAGETLARLGGRTCVAPVGGVIAAVDAETGYVTIAPDPSLVELKAAIAGFVMDTQPYESVTIETPAVQVFGAFGMGEERFGVLHLLVTDPNDVVTDEMITARSAYSIIIGGASITAAALRRAVKEQVRGVIVGGIEEHELRAFLNMQSQDVWRVRGGSWRFPAGAGQHDPGLTLIVTEGFGVRPMSAPAFDILAEQTGHEALVEGTTVLRQPLVRPRVVVPIQRASEVQLDGERPPLRPGAYVRLLDDEHLGQVARVRAVPLVPRRVGSQALVPVVEVELRQGEAMPLVLPRSAVEVLAV